MYAKTYWSWGMGDDLTCISISCLFTHTLQWWSQHLKLLQFHHTTQFTWYSTTSLSTALIVSVRQYCCSSPHGATFSSTLCLFFSTLCIFQSLNIWNYVILLIHSIEPALYYLLVFILARWLSIFCIVLLLLWLSQIFSFFLWSLSF